MAALYPAPALRALSNVDVKAAHTRSLHGELFLVLGRDADAAHRPVTMRTRDRQRRRVGLVDVRGPRATGAAAIGRTRFATRTLRVRPASATRERSGLAVYRAPRRLEVVLQLLILAPQPLALGFRAAQVLAQPRVVSSELFDDLLRVSRRRRLVALRHAAVMPNPRSKYKREMRVSVH